MYKVKLVTDKGAIKSTIKKFDTLFDAQHCAYLNFNTHVVTINGEPFTEEDYELHSYLLNYIDP